MSNLIYSSGYIFDVNRNEDILYFTLNENGVEINYESSFDIVLEEHKKLIKSGVYIQYVEDLDSGVAFIFVENQECFTEEDIKHFEIQTSELIDSVKWE